MLTRLRPRTPTGDPAQAADAPEIARPPRTPSIMRVVARFMAASLCALVLFGIIGLTVQRRVSTKEAIRDSSERATLVGRGIVQPALTDGVIAGDPAAIARLDEVVRTAVLDENIVRLKIWTKDGRIVYSDAAELIGERFPLPPDDLEVFETGKPAADLSDVSSPENRYERPFGKLLQVYLPLESTGGQPVLFEMYERYQGVVEGGRRLWLLFALPLLLSIALLWIAQAPLAWSLARRLRADQRDRERLLRRAIETSNLERRRIAADLHDGVVQQLAGTAYNLAAAEEEARSEEQPNSREAFREGTANVRQVIRQLRSLIVEIHPPNLRNEGLRAALTDLVSRLGAHGIDVTLDVTSDSGLGRDAEELCFRAAQEGVRNVVAHSGATHVTVRFIQDGGNAVLSVEDDGRGFAAGRGAESMKEGHVGLTLLGELATDLGGELRVTSAPGEGCALRLEVPWR